MEKLADRIKGITVEIGGDTTGLSKALSGVNKEISSTQKELKDVERLLKMDPGNTELLRQKYELLNKSIDATENKLDTLKEAEKQVQAQFQRGDIGETQYNALKREIIATESNLRNLKSEAQQAQKKINDVNEKPIEDVAKAADNAGDALKDAGKEASNFGDYLKAGAIVEGAKGIIDSLKNMSEETKEYRKIMGSLEISSQNAGYTAEQTAKSYNILYGVLADDQTAATTTANLQALGLSQKDLTTLIDGTIGAWATYGDSIPIDSLSEAINETVKTGTVTGSFADVLNWAGKSEDEFNKKLEAANSETERANLVLQELSNQGLVQAGEAWQQNNEGLVASNQASANLQEQIAKLGETVEPVITGIVTKVSELLSWFNNLDSTTQTIILTILGLVAAIGPLIGAFEGVTGLIGKITTSIIPGLGSAFTTLTGTVLPAVGNAFSSVFSFIAANPIVLLISAIVGLVTLIATKGDEIQAILQKLDDFLQNIFAKDWTEIFGPVLGEALNALFANIKNIWDSIKQVFDGIINFIRGVFTGDWSRAWEGVKQIFGGIFNGLIAIAKAPLNAVIGLINGMINGINWVIEKINSISVDLPDLLGGGHIGFNIPKIGNIAYLAKGGILSQGSAVVGEAGPELLTISGNSAIVQPLTNQTKNTTNLGGINMVVYGAPGQDVTDLADIIMDKIESATQRKAAIYA